MAVYSVKVISLFVSSMKSDLLDDSSIPFLDHQANVLTRLFPSIATQVLFLCEIVFTLLKGSLLVKTCRGRNCKRAIYFFFAMESLAGIGLIALFAREVLLFWKSNKNATVLSAMILVLFTELFTILTEAMVIRARLGDRRTTETRAGKVVRAVLKAIAFFCSTGITSFALYAEIVEASVSSQTTSQRRSGIAILSAALAVNVLILLICLFCSSFLKTRANISILCVATVSISSILSALLSLFEVRPRGRVGFDFPMHTTLAIFFLASGTFSSAVSTWFMPVLLSKIETSHVDVLETTALSVIGPAVIIGISRVLTTNALHVLLTILPQSGALVAPLVLSYAISMFRKPTEVHADNESM